MGLWEGVASGWSIECPENELTGHWLRPYGSDLKFPEPGIAQGLKESPGSHDRAKRKAGPPPKRLPPCRPSGPAMEDHEPDPLWRSGCGGGHGLATPEGSFPSPLAKSVLTGDNLFSVRHHNFGVLGG